MEEIGITIIGAGVIGLAVAYELSHGFDNIVVLEKNESFGQETSSRNSEVIHSGIYYPESSLKARLCVEGARDFIIRNESDKGFDGFINLIGIESPGLTASLAIAKKVKDIIISN